MLYQGPMAERPPPLEMVVQNGDGLKPSLIGWQRFETSAAQTFNSVTAVGDWHVMKVTSCHIMVLWLRGHHHLKWLEQ
jgi:hypothetical protein